MDGGVFHWGSADDSVVGAEEGLVAVVVACIGLGASSRGVRVVASFDSWRCRRTACKRASVFACWSATLACAARASSSAALRAASCCCSSSAPRLASAWVRSSSRWSQILWRSAVCCCCNCAVCCACMIMSSRRDCVPCWSSARIACVSCWCRRVICASSL